jgi:hypothetical protein
VDTAGAEPRKKPEEPGSSNVTARFSRTRDSVALLELTSQRLNATYVMLIAAAIDQPVGCLRQIAATSISL